MSSVEVVGEDIVVKTVTVALQEIFTGELQYTFDYATARVVEWEELEPQWAVDNLYQDMSFVGPFPPLPLMDVAIPDRDANLERLAPAQPGDPFFSDLVKFFKEPETVIAGLGNAAWEAVKNISVSVWKAVTPDSFEGGLELDFEMTLGHTTNVLKYDYFTKFNEDGKLPIELKLSGEAQFGGSITYNPGTQIFIRVPNVDSDVKLKFSMAIDSYFLTSVDIDILLQAALQSAGGKDGADLQQQLGIDPSFAESAYTYFAKKAVGEPDTAPAGGWKRTVFISKPSVQVIFAGPVPVPIVETFQLDLECGFAVRANLKVDISHKTSTTLKFKAFFEEGGEMGIDVPQFNRKVNSKVSVLGGGEASLTCSLIPRINVLAADTLGMNLGARVSGTAKAAYSSSCSPDPNESAPTGAVALGLYGGVGIQLGGRVQVPFSSLAGAASQKKTGYDIGPKELWSKDWTFIEKSWSVPGLGYCTPTCANGMTSASEKETDVDCGDGCSTRCEAGKKCKLNSDCMQGLFCANGTCSGDHCVDGVFSGDETAIDCGGPSCGKCTLQRSCFSGSDCKSGYCAIPYKGSSLAGKCVADPCQDGQRSNTELGVDCGGGGCPLCALGELCADNAGCASGASNGVMCVAGQCADLLQNGAETDVDCGGTSCAPCTLGKQCLAHSDCSAKAPYCDPDSLRCAKPLCANGLKNPGEVDVDCAGTCPAACADGKSCNTSSDCASGVCQLGTCLTPSCTDNVKNGNEPSVDCGGSCPNKCPLGLACVQGEDCSSGFCVLGLCNDAPCTAALCADANPCTDDQCLSSDTFVCPPGATAFQGRCYAARIETLDWNQAAFVCAELGAGFQLVSIGNAAENSHVRTLANQECGSDKSVSIGLSDSATEGQFEWESGEPLLYTNWNSGEPNNANN